MKLHQRTLTILIRGILSLLCRVDAREIERIPGKGPLIVVLNHINFLEVPLFYTYLYPRPQSSLVKAETWDIFFLGYFARIWDAIPVRRDAVDFSALRASDAMLQDGRLLLVAPEGTRTGDGRLKRGKAGVVYIAARNRVPIVPLVHYGGENFWRRFKRGRRTDFTFRAGSVFRLESGEAMPGASIRQEMTDEIMAYMASLLPPSYRGFYADKIPDSYRYLRFDVEERG